MRDIDRIDLIESVRREAGRLLYQGEEGSLVYLPSGNTVLSDIADGRRLCALVREFGLTDAELFEVKHETAAAALPELRPFPYRMDCDQWVYVAQTPPPRRGADIRPLTREWLPLAAQHYSVVDDPAAYLEGCLMRGRLWGLFEGEDLAGFIGTHPEGSMGLLEIFPAYRRKGYGYELEAFLVEWLLCEGFVPYCHVARDNAASIALQQKLGLTRAALPALWVYGHI